MRAPEANHRVSRQRGVSRGSRRAPGSHLSIREAGVRKPETKPKGDELPPRNSQRGDENPPIRVRHGESRGESQSAANPPGQRMASPIRREAAAPGPEIDLDSRFQFALDLSDPEPRGYEASATPPRERIDTTRWLWLAMAMGMVTCPILLGFQLVFTNPAHGLNVLAVVGTVSFGALFASWTLEFWLRRGSAATPKELATWALTRHAILVSIGVAAMAVSALNRTASFGLLVLVVFTLVVADIVLRRLRIR